MEFIQETLAREDVWLLAAAGLGVFSVVVALFYIREPDEFDERRLRGGRGAAVVAALRLEKPDRFLKGLAPYLEPSAPPRTRADAAAPAAGGIPISVRVAALLPPARPCWRWGLGLFGAAAAYALSNEASEVFAMIGGGAGGGDRLLRAAHLRAARSTGAPGRDPRRLP